MKMEKECIVCGCKRLPQEMITINKDNLIVGFFCWDCYEERKRFPNCSFTVTSD